MREIWTDTQDTLEEKIVFRQATGNDLDAIVRIYERTHDTEEAGLTTTGWLRGVYPVRRVAEESLARGDLYVAELVECGQGDEGQEERGCSVEGQEVRGRGDKCKGTDTVARGRVVASGIINQIQVDVYALCDWKYKGPDNDVSVLHTLVVDPEARGMGIGPGFVRFWEQLAAEEGCSILRIDTNARNSRARRMYAKLGYIESDIVPTVFNGIPGVDLVLMEKFNGTEIQQRLREMKDDKYADFQIALIPGKDREAIIGVRTPQLRAYAKELLKAAKDAHQEQLDCFLDTLPHKYFDEMQLHAFLISETKDFGECVEEVESFLPYVDNWATCDQLSPKIFGKKKNGRLVYASELLGHIDGWLESDETYTVRFGIGMLLQHFLDADFDPAYMDRVAKIRSDEYYINMIIAWYFATALAKQYDAALPVLVESRLDVWTHNKTIQKAMESRRITDEQKEYLKTLRRKA